MKILFYEKTFCRIKEKLSKTAPAVTPIIMHNDGSLSCEGKTIDKGDAQPEAAFGCSDLYNLGPARDFMILLLKSETMRWMQSGAAGFDAPVFGRLAEKGVRLTKSNSAAIAIAEFVMGSVLNAFQPNRKRRESQQKREWAKYEFQEIHGTSWLIIGLGNVGREIAVRASAFGCRVTGVRRKPVGNEPATEVITSDKIMSVLPSTDVVVLSASLNSETKHMVNNEFLAAMKPASVLVNVGRGSLIDEDTLIKSLDKGIPACAILDVFETEPLPRESPLWTHPRVRATAHCSARSPEKQARGDRVFFDNLKRYMDGNPLCFEVDRSEFNK
ncbi:D-2-hydroxyacid dehydrogenase [Thermodesulfobacteriota bacterium]